MLRSRERMDRMCLARFLLFFLMLLGSLAEWAALIHFNLIDSGWAYWRGGVIASVAYLLIVYMSVKKGEDGLLYAVLIAMAAPWICGAVVFVGYSLIVWHIPEIRYLDFSFIGGIQILSNVLGAILAVKTWLEN